MTPTDEAAGSLPPPAVLKPYHLAVDTIWRRLLRYGLIAALGLFMVIYGFYYAVTTPWLLVPFTLPFGIMLLIVIWALPDMRAAPTLTMERLYFAFYVCLAVWPNYLAISLPGLPWITFIRLTGFPMVLALLICLSVSSGFRKDMADVLSPTPWIWKPVTAFAVIVTYSIALSAAPMASLQYVIAAQVNWIAVFFLSVYIFSKPGRVERWAYLFWGMLLVLAVIAIREDRIQRVLWAGHIPSFFAINDPVVQSVLGGSYRKATGEYRVKAMFTTALGLAEFMALSIPFVLHFMMGPFRRAVKIAAIITLPIAFFVVLVTGSRLGMVGTLIGILLYSLLWGARRWRQEKAGIVGPALLLAYPAIFVFVAGATFAIPRLRRMVWGGGATDASDATRDRQVTEGIPKILHNPFGYGIGRGAAILGIRGSHDTLTIDNYYISVALDYGVIGFIVFYGMILATIIYATRAALRAPDDREFSYLMPIAVSLSSFFVIKWVFAQSGNHSLVFMMMGAVAALLWRLKRLDDAAAPPRSRLDR